MKTDVSQKIEPFSVGKEKLPLGHAIKTHTSLMKIEQNLTKKQSGYEILYWRYLGFFFLACLVFSFLYSNGILNTPFIGIVFLGSGCLLALVAHLPEELQNGKEIAVCIKQGRDVESNYTHEVAFRYFEILESNKRSLYWCYLINRLLPMEIIGVSTSIAGALLAIKAGMWLAGAVAVFSATVLLIGGVFYAWAVKKAASLRNV